MAAWSGGGARFASRPTTSAGRSLPQPIFSIGMAAQSVLLIDRGDLPSLVGATLEPDPSRMVIWHRRGHDAGATGRSAATKDHAEAMGARRVILTEPIVLGMQDMAPPSGLFQTGLLLEAAVIAQQVGCSKVVWPYHVGADAERVGEAVGRANLVASLAERPVADDRSTAHRSHRREDRGPRRRLRRAPLGLLALRRRWIGALRVLPRVPAVASRLREREGRLAVGGRLGVTGSRSAARRPAAPGKKQARTLRDRT